MVGGIPLVWTVAYGTPIADCPRENPGIGGPVCLVRIGEKTGARKLVRPHCALESSGNASSFDDAGKGSWMTPVT